MPYIPLIVSPSKNPFQLITNIPVWISLYKYWLATSFFIVYMVFFDQYRIPVAFSIYKNLNSLEREKKEFQKLIIKVKEDKLDIENNYEKFAREKYYMSRSDEDVFVVERK